MKPQDRTRAFLTAKIDAQSKLVGIAIADHMDVHDTCYPSVGRLAEVTDLNERTVQRILKAAHEAGWLQSTGKPGGRRTFAVAWDVLAVALPIRASRGNPRTSVTPVPVSPPAESHPTPVPVSPGGVTLSPERVTECHPKRDHEKQTNEPTTGGSAREEEASTHVTPDPEHTPLVVNGIELPRDLPALLSTIHPGFMHYIRMLLPAGVTTTEHLLRLTREEWRFMGHGLNPAKVNAIGDHLRREWGVDLGALAKAEERLKGKATAPVPVLFAPKSSGPSVDAIEHLFRKKETPKEKEVTRAE